MGSNKTVGSRAAAAPTPSMSSTETGGRRGRGTQPALPLALPPMTPAIIRRQVVLEELDVAANGRFAIVARRFVDRRDRYSSHLWLVPLVGGLGRTRALTSGPVHDGRPRISPDGSRVAFRRRRLEGKEPASTLEILELPGRYAPLARDAPLKRGGPGGRGTTPGEPWTLIAPDHGVGELAWSPSGDRLAYTSEAGPARFLIPEGRPRGTGQAKDKDPGREIGRAHV